MEEAGDVGVVALLARNPQVARAVKGSTMSLTYARLNALLAL